MSLELFELIVELYVIMMSHHIFIHIVHVAGTRLIQLGFDGLS